MAISTEALKELWNSLVEKAIDQPALVAATAGGGLFVVFLMRMLSQRRAVTLKTEKKEKKKKAKAQAKAEKAAEAAPLAPEPAVEEKKSEKAKKVSSKKKKEEKAKQDKELEARLAKEEAEARAKAEKKAAKKAEQAAKKAEEQGKKLTKQELDEGWEVAEAPKKKKSGGSHSGSAGAGAATKAAAQPEAPKVAEVPTEDRVTVKIDGKMIGVLIGPKGAHMKAIQEGTGAKIDLPQKTDANGNPVRSTALVPVVITGTPEECKACERAVKDIASKGYCKYTVGEDFQESSMQVHPQYFSELIGAGGIVIRAIQDTIGARLSMPDTQAYGSGPSAKPQKVGIAGTKASVAKAKEVIREIMLYHHSDITHPGMTHVQIQVPNHALSQIIGPGGSEIRHIQANFKTKVHIPNEASMHEDVVVVGSASAVAATERYIQKKITNAPSAQQVAARQTGAFQDEDEEPHEEWMDEFIYRRS